jgi:hypothetical protein
MFYPEITMHGRIHMIVPAVVMLYMHTRFNFLVIVVAFFF